MLKVSICSFVPTLLLPCCHYFYSYLSCSRECLKKRPEGMTVVARFGGHSHLSLISLDFKLGVTLSTQVSTQSATTVLISIHVPKKTDADEMRGKLLELVKEGRKKNKTRSCQAHRSSALVFKLRRQLIMEGMCVWELISGCVTIGGCRCTP